MYNRTATALYLQECGKNSSSLSKQKEFEEAFLTFSLADKSEWLTLLSHLALHFYLISLGDAESTNTM